MDFPLAIPLRVSRRLVTLLALAHLLAIVAILPLMLAWPLRLAMIGLVVVSLVYFLGRHLRSVVVGLHLGAQGEIEVDVDVGASGWFGRPAEAPKVGAGGTATILPQTTVLPGVIVLRLRKGGRLLTLPLLPDSTGATAYRQLCVWLKWRAKLG
ncbi:MAG: protein YgfX [Rhodocyclaceae bacterium]